VNDKRPVEGPAPSLAWPVVHSAAEPPPPRAPWSRSACFIVRDANGHALAARRRTC
jgi:hypothetical protein